WALMPLLAYLKVDQLTEVLFTNGGFIIITVLFFRNMIEESRKDYFDLVELKRRARPEPEILLENCKQYMLTPRECEVTHLVCEGEKYRDIAEKLFISERTVTKHVQNIFKKTEVTSKIELLNKLGEKAKIKDAAR